MSSVGAPTGNQNAAKARIWSAAIERMIRRDREGLEALAKALIDKAKAGDMVALKEIGDRLEGKPKQTIEGPGEDGSHILHQKIETVIIDAKS